MNGYGKDRGRESGEREEGRRGKGEGGVNGWGGEGERGRKGKGKGGSIKKWRGDRETPPAPPQGR